MQNECRLLAKCADQPISWVVFRENVDRRLLLGAFAILLGACVLSWTGRGISMDVGAIFIDSACVAWGVYNNLTRKLSSSDPVQIAMSKGLAAGGENEEARGLLEMTARRQNELVDKPACSASSRA